MKKFNEFISWIFNPLNFPITGTLLFFNYCMPTYKTDDKLSVSIIVLLTTMVIPVGYLIYKKQKQSNSRPLCN